MFHTRLCWKILATLGLNVFCYQVASSVSFHHYQKFILLHVQTTFLSIALLLLTLPSRSPFWLKRFEIFLYCANIDISHTKSRRLTARTAVVQRSCCGRLCKLILAAWRLFA